MFQATLAALLLAVAASAQTPQTVTVMVPIVGSVLGAGDVRWKTEVEIYNDSRDEMFVALRLPTTIDQPTIAFTLGGGRTQRFADVIGEAFGLDSVLSPLIVETLGKRSVRVKARVYAVHSEGVTQGEPVPVTYAESGYPIRTLNGLSFSDVFRTNVGLVNLSDRDATFTLALQRVAGRNIAVTRLSLSPNSLSQTSIQTLFPLITKGDDFSVVIETNTPNTYVYASVIENATSDARFIPPATGAPQAQFIAGNAQ